MSSQMCPKIEIETKALATDLTLVRLFASMNKLVSLELGIIEELLVTTFYWANEHSLAMRHLMLAEGAVVWECLLTIFNMTLVNPVLSLISVELQLVLRVIRVVLEVLEFGARSYQIVDLAVNGSKRINFSHLKCIIMLLNSRI